MSVLTAEELMDRPDPEWLVSDVFQAESLAMLWGDEGTFKSFTMIDLAGCIANGQDWHEHPVRPGKVVYVAAEGTAWFKYRLDAWFTQNQADRRVVPFYTVDEPVALVKPGAVDALCDELAAKGVTEASLVVFDTWAMCGEGAEENSNTDFGTATRAMNQLRRRLGATIVLVAHGGPDGPRGAKSQKGNLDTLVYIKRRTKKSRDFTLTCKKQKDGNGGFDDIHLSTVEVKVGTNKDGRPITSLAVVDDDQPAPAQPAAPAAPAHAATTAPQPKRPRVTAEVVSATLRRCGATKPATLARLLSAELGVEVRPGTVREHLRRLKQTGRVRCLNGQYHAVTNQRHAA